MARVLALALVLALGCGGGGKSRNSGGTPGGDAHARERGALVDTLLARGITDERVLTAIGRVPRHEMVPQSQQPYAYEDRPLPIGFEQTISQPFVVAEMTVLAELRPGERVLEVGTGSGYQAAVLAELGAEVYSIEIVAPLAQLAEGTLRRLGYDRIQLRVGDGYLGWPEAAPFDAIIVTAAAPQVPPPLVEQLKVGGKLVIPIGPDGMPQELRVVTRKADGTTVETVADVRFVPMTGRAQE